MNRSSRGHIVTASLMIAALVAGLWLIVNRQYVIDQINVWRYQPSSQMLGLVAKTGINDQGKFYLYTTHPSLETAAGFNDKCDRKEQGTAILGCYNGRNIYIYDVTDPKLGGIREVTIAHEMLHAAYDRLDKSEVDRINALLDAEYATLKSDKKFVERIAFYERTEPGERYNELHSIIGTEIASISPELESHYKKYFDDRARIVVLHGSYERVFTDLEARSDALVAELKHLEDTIESRTAAYNADVNQLNADITAFNNKANRGGFATQSAFQAERTALMARSDVLDGTRIAINEQIQQYETLRKELDDLAIQTEALNRSLDSSLAPAPSL